MALSIATTACAQRLHAHSEALLHALETEAEPEQIDRLMHERQALLEDFTAQLAQEPARDDTSLNAWLEEWTRLENRIREAFANALNETGTALRRLRQSQNAGRSYQGHAQQVQVSRYFDSAV